MPEQRKLVTVLFADVTGSTSLGEELDPEDVRILMIRYYEHAQRILADHGGTLEKFIGDAVMAVFGLPVAHSDDPERAIASALALRNRITEDAALRGKISLRIGVNTGEVVAPSRPSEEDFLVTGDCVNLAARLEQHSTPGEILVADRTEMSTRHIFQFGRPRRLRVKGKSQAIKAFPVLGLSKNRASSEPPFVGRKADLAQLHLLLSRAMSESRPQLVSIMAPAGAGKTRLVEEFLKTLDPSQAICVATARCIPYGETVTYWPLRSMLNGLLGGDVTADGVTAAFSRGGLNDDDAARLSGLIMATLGSGDDRPADQASILNAWRLLVEMLARDRPLIIVVEDLHWAGDPLIDLVEHIMAPRAQAKLLVVVLSRPQLLERRPSWGGGRANFTSIVLNPLTSEETQELVCGLWAGLSELRLSQIVERSGGNPFFALELVRSLREVGARGQQVSPDILPDTVHAALLSRLDLLPVSERVAIRAASVLGRSFSTEAISVLVQDLSREEIEASLDGIAAKQLVSPTADGRLQFQHGLIRDVAYGTLSRPERVRMHTAAGGWLEERAGDRLDEFASLIAYHYREALKLHRESAAPLPETVDSARVIALFERAGELASRSGAFAEAAAHLQAAIELAQEADHTRLYEMLGDAWAVGDRAIRAYEAALEGWRASGQVSPVVGVRLLRKLLTSYLRWGGNISETPPEQRHLHEIRTEARRLAEEAGDMDEKLRLEVLDLFFLVSPLVSPVVDEDVAVDALEEPGRRAMQAAEHFREREDWESFHMALDAYGSVMGLAGRHQEILDAMAERLDAPEVGSLERGDALNMTAWAHLDLGEYAQAIACMEDALSGLRPGDPRSPFGNGLALASLAAAFCGQWDKLNPLFAALEDTRAEMKGSAAYLRRGYLARLHVATARDDRDAVEGALSALTSLYAADGDYLGLTIARAYVADSIDGLQPALEEHGLEEEAAACFALMFLNERSVSLSDRIRGFIRSSNSRSRPAADCLGIADALANGDPAQLRSAIDRAETGGLMPHAARMRVILGEMTGAEAQIQKGRRVLQELGDVQFLRRVTALGHSARHTASSSK